MDLIKTVRFHILITVAIAVVVLVVRLLIFKELMTLMSFVFGAGYLGGIINSYQRVKNLPPGEVAFENKTANTIAIIQVYTTPLVSGLFALIFYALCFTGVIGGDLFPNFIGIDKHYSSILDMFDNAGPENNIDAAKAIVWGFIAGFSERLVPNVLDKVVTEVDAETK